MKIDRDTADSKRSLVSMLGRSEPDRHRWLELIGALKLVRGAIFVAIAFALLRVVHHDIYMLALRAVEGLHLDPERAEIAKLLNKTSLLTVHRMKQIVALVFVYASLDLIEGIGLLLEKRWAEYFTLIFTVALLPFEAVSLIHHPDHWTWFVFLTNIVIVIYLAWLVQPHKPVGRRQSQRSQR